MGPLPLFAMFGLQALSSIFGGKAQRAQIRAQEITARANADAQNIVRDGQNQFTAAQGSLNRFTQGENNKLLLKAAGDQFGAAGENIVRQLDASTKGTLEQRLQASEQLGAISVAASAAGVGGNTVDMINRTTRLRNARVEQDIKDNKDLWSYDALKQRTGIMENAWNSLDNRLILDGMDYNINQAPVGVGGGNVLSDLFGITPGVKGVDFGLLADGFSSAWSAVKPKGVSNSTGYSHELGHGGL